MEAGAYTGWKGKYCLLSNVAVKTKKRDGHIIRMSDITYVTIPNQADVFVPDNFF